MPKYAVPSSLKNAIGVWKTTGEGTKFILHKSCIKNDSRQDLPGGNVTSPIWKAIEVHTSCSILAALLTPSRRCYCAFCTRHIKREIPYSWIITSVNIESVTGTVRGSYYHCDWSRSIITSICIRCPMISRYLLVFVPTVTTSVIIDWQSTEVTSGWASFKAFVGCGFGHNIIAVWSGFNTVRNWLSII